MELSCDDAIVDGYAAKLKVLGHPLRLRLLCLIEQGKDPCVSELWECLNQPQPVVSQHLAVLKERGIVSSEVRGNKRVYHISDTLISDLISMLHRHADRPLVPRLRPLQVEAPKPAGTGV